MLLSWLLYGHTLATIWLHEMSTLFFYTFQVVDYYVYKNKRPLKQLLLQESFIYPKGRTSDEKMSSSGLRPLSIFILTISLGLLDIL